mmetsp:Transcript_38330/g.92458  ORF Transcript_38330/g.92458 Transcript_38330/m.92458 type:complete len:211 (-) Transcript_38330:151-783(-)
MSPLAHSSCFVRSPTVHSSFATTLSLSAALSSSPWMCPLIAAFSLSTSSQSRRASASHLRSSTASAFRASISCSFSASFAVSLVSAVSDPLIASESDLSSWLATFCWSTESASSVLTCSFSTLFSCASVSICACCPAIIWGTSCPSSCWRSCFSLCVARRRFSSALAKSPCSALFCCDSIAVVASLPTSEADPPGIRGPGASEERGLGDA